MNIGNRIKELREKANLSNSALASLAGLSQPVMYRLENNERAADIETLEKVCTALNITLIQFLNDDIEPIVITPELKKLLDSAKNLNSEQLEHLINFISSIKVTKTTVNDNKLEYAQEPGGRKLTEEEEQALSEYFKNKQ